MTEKAAINLNGEFTATELEDIIRELAEVRAGMRPAVPSSPPGDTASEADVLVQDNASFIVRTLASGGLRFWLRNDGIGWLVFNLPPERRESFMTFLGKKPGHSHTAH